MNTVRSHGRQETEAPSILEKMKNNRLMFIMLTTGGLLLIPLVAMRFTEEVHWTLSDFLVAGSLLLCAGLTLEFVMRKVTNIKVRVALCALLLVMLVLTWTELAVGIFGTPFAGS